MATKHEWITDGAHRARERVESGRCSQCASPAVAGRSMCEKHLLRFRNRAPRKGNTKCTNCRQHGHNSVTCPEPLRPKPRPPKVVIIELERRLAQTLDDCETLRQAADQMRAGLDRAESDNAALRAELRRRAAAERSLRAQLGGSHAVRTPDVALHTRLDSMPRAE